MLNIYQKTCNCAIAVKEASLLLGKQKMININQATFTEKKWNYILAFLHHILKLKKKEIKTDYDDSIKRTDIGFGMTITRQISNADKVPD